MRSDLTPSDSDLQAIALTGRMLGALYYHAPEESLTSELYQLLQDDSWVKEWPCSQPLQLDHAAALIREGLTQPQPESIEEAYQRLFIGPNSLAAPPWGSVYLDHEMVIFGESTLALRQWQAELGIEVEQEQREPEDHIGLMLMLAAWLVEHYPEKLTILLEEHLLPWSKRYLALLVEHAHYPFYQGLGELTQLTLDDWQQRLNTQPVKKQIFF